MVLRTSTATTCNTTLYFSKNNTVAEGGGLDLSLDVEKLSASSLKRPLKKGDGIPDREHLMLSSTTTLLNNKRMLKSLNKPQN